MILYGILFSLIGALFTGAYGYYKGYTICNQAQEIKMLNAQIKVLKLSQAYLKSSLAAAQEASKSDPEIEKSNQELVNELQNQIKAEREKAQSIIADCTFDADFLRRTDNIR